MKYQYPFKGKWVETCKFGKEGAWACGWHIGVDLVGTDDKNVYPIGEGYVSSVGGHGSSYGKHLTVKHPDGMTSLYAHLDTINVIRGQTVYLDTKLGIMGATGNAKGAHLHLELHKGNYKYPPKMDNWARQKLTTPVNPMAYIEYSIKEGGLMEPREIIVQVKGNSVRVDAINVDGNNFIKLRDVAKIVAELSAIKIGYDEGTSRITID